VIAGKYLLPYFGSIKKRLIGAGLPPLKTELNCPFDLGLSF